MLDMHYQQWNGQAGLRTLCPSSQLIHRSPLVRKQATACLARWWIQPSCLSWVMMASMKGNPVLALKETHNIQNDGDSLQTLWLNNFTKFQFFHSTTAVKTWYLSPRSQVLCVFVPIHLSTHRVALHLVKVGDTKTGCVEELPPEELAMEGYRRVRVLPLQHKQCWNLKQHPQQDWDFFGCSNPKNPDPADFSEQNPERIQVPVRWHNGDTHPLIDFSQLPPKQACRQAAKSDIGAEDSGAGTQGVGRRLWLLEPTHPLLKTGAKRTISGEVSLSWTQEILSMTHTVELCRSNKCV